MRRWSQLLGQAGLARAPLIVAAGLVVVAAPFAVALAQGWLGEWYTWLWMNTTGRPYTEVIRENVWLFTAPAALVLGLTLWAVPQRHWGRTLVVYVAFILGFLSGHFFWGA